MPVNPKEDFESAASNALQKQAAKILQKVTKAAIDETSAKQAIAALTSAAADEGIRFISTKMNEEQALLLQKQREELMSRLMQSPYIKGLQQKFIATIFPIGGSIVMTAYNLYNAVPPIMSEEQRNMLTAIGKRMSDIPTKMLTGEYKLQEAYAEFVGTLKSLTSFVTNKDNLNIAINIGATLLESIHPIGSFIKHAVTDLLKSGMPKTVQEATMKGLGVIATHYDKLETGLKNAAEKGLALAADNKLSQAIKPIQPK